MREKSYREIKGQKERDREREKKSDFVKRQCKNKDTNVNVKERRLRRYFQES